MDWGYGMRKITETSYIKEDREVTFWDLYCFGILHCVEW
jgi:hypothetical protein